jgi:hypothetical protein
LVVSNLTADLSVALDTIARTVQGWLDDHEKSLKDAEGFQCDITDDFHMIRFPGGEWPSRGMFKNWVSALRAAASSVETKATRTYVAVVEPHHDRMKIGDRVVMIERIYAALGMDLPVCPHGLRYVENTCGPCSQGRPNRTPEHPETTVQPDEKCGNCGDDYSKHLGERLICPDAAMPDIYRWTAEPTQVKAGG